MRRHRCESGTCRVGIAVKTVHWRATPGFRCSRARRFHCGTRILTDGHCAFHVPEADQRRRIPLPGCAGRGGGLAGPAIGAPAAATSGPVPSDRAHRPRLMTGPTGSQPHRYQPFRVQPRHRGRKPPVVSPHWGRLIPIGAGNHSLGQANNLPQCTVTYPDATTHPPQQCPATEKLPHCLPQ